MHIFRDEQRKPSTSRIAFWLALINVLLLVWRDALGDGVVVSNAAYSMMGGIMLALTAWAAGPRIAQYIGPQFGGFAAAIGQAVLRPPLTRPIDNPDKKAP